MAQIPPGFSLLSDGFESIVSYGPGVTDSMIKIVSVTGQPFSKAYLINTFNKPSVTGDYGFNADIKTPLHKGDVLWISFKGRCLESKRESGEAFVQVRLDQLVNGKYVWPSHLERGVSIGKNWSETSIPFVMKKDADPSNLRFVIKFDTYAQRFELGPIAFINYGPTVKLTDLPHTVVHYEGDAINAPWRKAAAERIEKYRKGNLTVKVVDENGKAVNGAIVSVKLKKIAFGWGTATNSKLILDTIDNTTKIYRDTLLKYFNKVVLENEIKSKNWARSNHVQSIKAVHWFNDHNISVRGHVMVWPSWQNSPHLINLKNDTAALRVAILKDIDQETTVMKNQFAEWDVVNEPFAHDVFLNLLGREVMVDWFNLARKNAPGVKLFLNDYTMFHTDGNGSESFYNTIKFLKEKGAPIDAIGEQAHIGGTPPGIDYVIERLNHFAEFGLPIQISEFDITSDDNDFKARYLRDFFTAIFSHPATMGIMQWGFWEGSHWIPAAALWDKDWNIRPEGKVFTELVSKTWNTNAEGLTEKNGVFIIRGFDGNYDVVVKKGNKVVEQKTELGSDGKTIIVKMVN